MASIVNPNFTAEKLAGSKWMLHLTYDATFSQYEVDHFTFRDGFVVWEDDPVYNDQLTGVVGVTYFNPSQKVVKRRLSYEIDEETLDTELGEEELFLAVRLRNVDLNWLYKNNSNIIHLSP